MLLRLAYWGKIVRMGAGRLVKQVYEAGLARLNANPKANTWCCLTRAWLLELGLQEAWQKQEVSDSWREVVKERIMTAEGVRWRSGVSRNARLEGYAKWKTGLRLVPEEYLCERNVNRRRLWSKLRAGCLELRVEMGRWERLTVAGIQKLVPRWARRCTLCYSQVEDAACAI